MALEKSSFVVMDDVPSIYTSTCPPWPPLPPLPPSATLTAICRVSSGAAVEVVLIACDAPPAPPPPPIVWASTPCEPVPPVDTLVPFSRPTCRMPPLPPLPPEPPMAKVVEIAIEPSPVGTPISRLLACALPPLPPPPPIACARTPYESDVAVFDCPPAVVTVEPFKPIATVPLPPPLPALPPIVMSVPKKTFTLEPCAAPPLPPPPPIDWAVMAGAALPSVLTVEFSSPTVTLPLLPPCAPAPPMARLAKSSPSCMEDPPVPPPPPMDCASTPID